MELNTDGDMWKSQVVFKFIVLTTVHFSMCEFYFHARKSYFDLNWVFDDSSVLQKSVDQAS